MNLKTLLFFITLFLAYSCAEKEEVENLSFKQDVPLSKYAVSCSDILKLSDNTRAANTDSYFEFLTYKGDTVLYLLHKGNGFELYSSDQRFAPLIAFNEHEDINLDSICPAQREWFEQMKENIYNFRHYDSTTVNSNSLEWSCVLKKPVARETATRFRSPDDPPRDGDENQGEWIWHNTRVEYSGMDVVNHLVNPLFSQKEPFNSFLPIRYDTIREPAGCLPVAVGQVIYYLHNKFGWSKETIGKATYNSETNRYNFTEWGKDAWNNDSCVYLMLAYLGNIGHARFENGETIVNEEWLPYMFISYNLFCESMSWNRSVIEQNIKNEIPILAILKNKNKQRPGHAILVDGYKVLNKDYYDVYINYTGKKPYIDIYDHASLDCDAIGGDPVPEEGPTKVEYIGSSSNFYYLINWGDGIEDLTYYHEDSQLSFGNNKFENIKRIYRIFKL